MGLISRVSSRTYRNPPPTMSENFELTKNELPSDKKTKQKILDQCKIYHKMLKDSRSDFRTCFCVDEHKEKTVHIEKHKKTKDEDAKPTTIRFMCQALEDFDGES